MIARDKHGNLLEALNNMHIRTDTSNIFGFSAVAEEPGHQPGLAVEPSLVVDPTQN